MITVKLYNTLSRQKESLVPINKNKIGLYTCGPTVYDRPHIGNFRTFLFEDVLKRTLELVGYEVNHVMNITDVDDKTINKTHLANKSLKEVTEHYTAEFMDDLKTLKIDPADHFPRATHFIDKMINMIILLIQKNLAYQTEDGSVFFSIKNYNRYGALIRLDIQDQRQTERIIADEYSKENPMDFALWKSWKNEDGIIFWESPWGKGRPGWHLECSVMSTELLGPHFDIHCGGIDNIFPHHENEIAQSKGALNSPFVNVWLHSEHLIIKDNKMSKSKGSIVTVPDLINMGHSSEVIRFTLINCHYRSKLIFTDKKLNESTKSVRRINDIYKKINNIKKSNIEKLPKEFDLFMSALCDDLNTPRALGIFFNYLRKINKKLSHKNLKSQEKNKCKSFIEKVDKIFCFLQKELVLPEKIQKMVELRDAARRKKDWANSDKIRALILNEGWVVEDTPSGSKCYPMMK